MSGVSPLEAGLKVNNRLWLISDTHFGHKNIIRYAQRPETHDTIMLSNWIDRVREEDQILHLGDVFLGGKGNATRWAKIISRLPGEKFLMKGNHDYDDDRLYERAGFTIVSPFLYRSNDGRQRIAFTHEPIGTKFSPGGFSLDSWDTNIHGHIHQGQMGDKDEYNGSALPGKQYINLSVEETGLAPIQFGTVRSRVLVPS